MLVKPFLGGLPIVWCNRDHAISTDFFGMTREIDRLIRSRHADMHDDRYSSGRDFDRGFSKLFPLVSRQIQGFGEMQVDAER